MEAEVLAARRFGMADQERFAAAFGDRNPMHMDAEAARRTQAGACAVHGVHGLLWALETLAAQGVRMAGLRSVKAEFTRFIAVDREVVLAVVGREDARLRVEVQAEGARMTALDLRFGADVAVPAGAAAGDAPPAVADVRDLSEMEGVTGRLAVPGRGGAEGMFPALCAALGRARVEAIGLASTVVGMVVPGLHSIFSGLVLTLSDDAGPAGLGYAVRRSDARFRLVTLGLEGPGLAGTATAFARYPPVVPPSLGAVRDTVDPKEFAERRALVIGGSRGIGAATALLIAAGGGSVAVTYRHGRAEAEALQAEIGAGCCRVAQYDALAEPGPQLEGLGSGFTHVYYFATGRIAGGGQGFDRAAFDGFAAVYLDGFARLAAWLGAVGDPVRLLYPSSTYVTARPKGLGEYAMAKAAGEVLCMELARTWPNLSISAPRLPRMFTDQTASVPPLPAEDPVAVMRAILRDEA